MLDSKTAMKLLNNIDAINENNNKQNKIINKLANDLAALTERVKKLESKVSDIRMHTARIR